jgi:hypothetical protein
VDLLTVFFDAASVEPDGLEDTSDNVGPTRQEDGEDEYEQTHHGSKFDACHLFDEGAHSFDLKILLQLPPHMHNLYYVLQLVF